MVTQELPILPLKNTVLFPEVIIPITVSREKSKLLIKESYESERLIGVVSQKNDLVEHPQVIDLNKIGTLARIIKIIYNTKKDITAIIQGKKKFNLLEMIKEAPYHIAKGTIIPEQNIKIDQEIKAKLSSIKNISLKIIKFSDIPNEAEIAIHNIENPAFFIHFISSNFISEVKKKQELLEIQDLDVQINRLLELLSIEYKQAELKHQIEDKVKSNLDKQKREFLLNEQLKTIQKELGKNGLDVEIETLKKKSKSKKWNASTKEHFDKEIEKLARMNPAAADYSIQINYLNLFLDLPWGEFSKDNNDLKIAKKILDEDHYGLEKVKDRILQYLAVLKIKKNMKSPILCLLGPPGVGKTSLGHSIARALNRSYCRMSLGGVHDEAEIRGHRKTYIGAMPGRIIHSIKKSKTSNPVFILDEIDKIGRDFRGDPSSALLEVLDPEQNNAFTDHFLDTEYDLSNILFIATANTVTNIQPALLDRLEIIEINGYTIEEKINIAQRYLLAKQVDNHGIEKKDIQLDIKKIALIIEQYTKESGVRNLEKKIASIVRNVTMKIACGESYIKKINKDFIIKSLGQPIFEKTAYESNQYAGVVMGLAWTPYGGDILFIEVSTAKGKDKLTLTGNLGAVIKESASIALSFVKKHATELKIDDQNFTNKDIHIHFPEGSTPKDGPSAGIALLTALVSALTKRKVKKQLAMTGEITLRGKVLPIGGIKEKILAAIRANIKEVILPKGNEKNVLEIKKKDLKGLKIHYVQTMKEVIAIALLKEKAIDNL